MGEDLHSHTFEAISETDALGHLPTVSLCF